MVPDYRDKDASIYVPHTFILPRLCGTAKTAVKHITQVSLLQRIFMTYSSLPRNAAFVVIEIAQGRELLGQSVASGVPLSNPFPKWRAQPTPPTHPELQGGELLPYHGFSDALILAPIGTGYDESVG